MFVCARTLHIVACLFGKRLYATADFATSATGLFRYADAQAEHFLGGREGGGISFLENIFRWTRTTLRYCDREFLEDNER